MKKINLLNQVSVLLLGSAIFFMSCSKEEMFSPKESKVNTGAENQATNTTPVTVASENSAAKSIPTLPSSPYWTKITPFTSSHSQFLTVIVEGKQINLEFYQRPAGSTGSPNFIASTVGNEYRASIAFLAQPGIEYFVKMSKMYTYSLWPGMGSLSIYTMYKMTLVGVGVNAGKFEEVGFSITPP